MSSSSSWQDRRFMFPAGREVHQGSRRYSGSNKDSDPSSVNTAAASAVAADSAVTDSQPPPTTTSTAAAAAMSTGKVLPSWEGDRRFMGTIPREIHEGAGSGARRNSQSSDKSTGSTGFGAVKTSASPPTSPGGGIAAAIAGRRRSSASNGGVFGGLMSTRSSKEDYDQRRQGWEDMKAPGGLGGLFGGFVNKSGDKK